MYRHTNARKAQWGKCPATVGTPRRSCAVWRALQRRLGAFAAHGGVHSAAQLLCMVVVVRLSALELRGSVADGIVARPRRGIAEKTPLRFTAAAKCSTLPRTWPYPTSRPARPRTRRAHGTVLRVFRDIPELERRSGECSPAPVDTRTLPAPDSLFTKLARGARQCDSPGLLESVPRRDPPPPARPALTGPYWGCLKIFRSPSGAWGGVCRPPVDARTLQPQTRDCQPLE